jgi:ribosomal protein S18 acetylase RimI-like enzyme
MLSHRFASADDVPALIDLVDSAYRGERSKAGWTTEEHLLGGQRIDAGMLQSTLDDPAQEILIVESDAAMVACVAVERRAGYGYVGMVTVAPTGQGGGLGRHLLDLAEAHIRGVWGLPRARMTVIAQRGELIAWYKRRGYADTGETEPFPYGDPRFGAPKRDDLYFTILEKPLGAASPLAAGDQP